MPGGNSGRRDLTNFPPIQYMTCHFIVGLEKMFGSIGIPLFGALSNKLNPAKQV